MAATRFEDADALVAYLTDLWCDDAGVGVAWEPARIAAEAIRAWQASGKPEQVAASVEDALDFEPDEHHTIADMANVGYSLMQAIKSNCPDYCWGESPAEIVVDLINQRDEAAGIVPGGAEVAASVAVPDDGLFYIQDTRSFVGNCPMWWGPNRNGYVTRLDEAGRYTQAEAMEQHRFRETDLPWPCAEIDALARKTVDHQHMRPRSVQIAALRAIGEGT